MLLTLTRRGEKLLKQLALTHRAELKTARSKLLQALTRVVVRDIPSARAHERRPARANRGGSGQATRNASSPEMKDGDAVDARAIHSDEHSDSRQRVRR